MRSIVIIYCVCLSLDTPIPCHCSIIKVEDAVEASVRMLLLRRRLLLLLQRTASCKAPLPPAAGLLESTPCSSLTSPLPPSLPPETRPSFSEVLAHVTSPPFPPT